MKILIFVVYIHTVAVIMRIISSCPRQEHYVGLTLGHHPVNYRAYEYG